MANVVAALEAQGVPVAPVRHPEDALVDPRVMARNGWAREAVEAVIRQQATRAQRLAAADAVVFNGAGNTLLQLERDVRALATSFGL